MSTLHPYQDRKRLKWMGFYLSEHTAQIDSNSLKNDIEINGKSDMSSQEIANVMEEALIKGKSVTIQTNQLVNHSYLPDVVGKIKGYNEEGLFIEETFVAYEEIKHVEIYQHRNWFDVD